MLMRQAGIMAASWQDWDKVENILFINKNILSYTLVPRRISASRLSDYYATIESRQGDHRRQNGFKGHICIA